MFLAASTGLPEELALQRVGEQAELAAALTDFEKDQSSLLSGVSVEVRTGEVLVRLVAGATSVLDFQVPESYQVKVLEGGKYTARQFADEATRIAAALMSLNVHHHGVEYDPRAGEILLLVGNEQDQIDLAGLTEYPFRIEVVEGLVGSANRGGVRMTSCTAGFSVRIPSGNTGLLTAGHCGNTQSYSTAPAGSISYSSTYVAGLNSPSADLQWHRLTSHTPVNQFYGSSATTATTRVGTGTAYVGQLLCHRGKTTGYSCGGVTSVTHAPPSSWNVCGGSACSANWVRVSGVDLANLGGDSGGPWFSGGYA